jgi:hypothetical protein
LLLLLTTETESILKKAIEDTQRIDTTNN